MSPHFNVMEDEWIPVRWTDGQLSRVGVRVALTSSNRIRNVETNIPTLWPPIVRLLLAVARRAINGPPTIDHWAAIHASGGFPADVIDEYCSQWVHRFELLDSSAPFMQVAELTHPGGPKPISTLISTRPSGNNVPVFQPVLEDTPFSLSLPDACLWLVHAHAWDTAGIKGAAAGDPQASAGKTTGNRVGSLGSLGVVIPVGESLFETLMLSLITHDEPNLLVADHDDKPCWERPPLTAEWVERPPTGPLDLFTWNARRLRLIPDEKGTGIDRMVLAAGDRTDLGAPFRRDPHTGFLRSANAESKAGSAPIYYPAKHLPDRTAWRGLASLLAVSSSEVLSLGTDAPNFVSASALTFVGTLRNNGVLPANYALRVVLVATEYGAQSAVVSEQFGDHLDLLATILDPTDPTLRSSFEAAVTCADGAAFALRLLTRQAVEAAGESDTDRAIAQGDARAAAFFGEIDGHFRRLLHSVTDADDPSLTGNWQQRVREIARGHASLVAADAPIAALRGRDGLNLAVAVNEFERRLRSATPLADEPTPMKREPHE